LLITVLTALLVTAKGTAIASLLEDMQGFQIIMNFLVMPIFFLSGALFFSFSIDLAVLTGVTALFLVLGSYLFSKIEI